MKRWRFIVTGLAGLLLLPACRPAPSTEGLAGTTMGTTYSIRIAGARLGAAGLGKLQADVDRTLDEVNRQMSTYRPDSEITRFNRSGADEPVAVSPDFLRVLRRGLEIAEASGGAFDPTVGALVAAWGFGAGAKERRRPDPETVAAARQQVGYRHLSIAADGRIAKDLAALQLDLSAIAKGYGVDRVAELLLSKNIRNFLVEIGGETRAEGVNGAGVPWRVGVQRPDYAPETGRDFEGVLSLTGGRAVATSGDYQNFYQDGDGATYAHIIDPRTAMPVRHGVASVSVLADDCLTADGLATTLDVLGPDEGIPWLAEHFPGAEVLFIVRQENGKYAEIASPGFAAALAYESLAGKAE